MENETPHHDVWACRVHLRSGRTCAVLVDRTATRDQQVRWQQAYAVARALLGEELYCLLTHSAPVILCDLSGATIPPQMESAWHQIEWQWVTGEELDFLLKLPRLNYHDVQTEVRALGYSFLVKNDVMTGYLLYGSG